MVLNISPNTFRNRLLAGHYLEPIKVGGKIRFNEKQLREILEKTERLIEKDVIMAGKACKGLSLRYSFDEPRFRFIKIKPFIWILKPIYQKEIFGPYLKIYCKFERFRSLKSGVANLSHPLD